MLPVGAICSLPDKGGLGGVRISTNTPPALIATLSSANGQSTDPDYGRIVPERISLRNSA